MLNVKWKSQVQVTEVGFLIGPVYHLQWGQTEGKREIEQYQ